MSVYRHTKRFSQIVLLLSIIAIIVLYCIMISRETSSKRPSAYRSAMGGDLNWINIKNNSKISSLAKSNSSVVDWKIKRPLRTEDHVLWFGQGKEKIKIGVVLCGDRLNQTIVTLKSAAMISKKSLHFIIVADDENRDKIENQLLEWPSKILFGLSFEIHPVTFPSGKDGEEWQKLFKLCACQRLFLPSLLKHIDSLIYVDTDVLFLRPVENLWKYFYKMNESQIAGLSPEHEDFATGWYNRFARHPFYEPLGVNSGVVLMNLTRMRAFNWESYLQPIMKEYKLKIVWGDQDIINIIFHFHSEKLYTLPCEWNFRPDHCMYSSVCKTAESNGIATLHGNRGVFHNNKQPAFKAVYEAIANYKIGSDINDGLLLPLKHSLSETSNSNCGKFLNTFVKMEEEVLERQVKLEATCAIPIVFT